MIIKSRKATFSDISFVFMHGLLYFFPAMIMAKSEKGSNVDSIKAGAGKSYSCQRDLDFKLDNGVQITFINIQIQPFALNEGHFSKGKLLYLDQMEIIQLNVKPI